MTIEIEERNSAGSAIQGTTSDLAQMDEHHEVAHVTHDAAPESNLSGLSERIVRYPDWDAIETFVDVSHDDSTLYISDLKSNEPLVNACVEFLEFCKISFTIEIMNAKELNKRVSERKNKGGLTTQKVHSSVQQSAKELFSRAASLDASDIHVEITNDHTEIEFRVNGDLERQRPILREEGDSLIQSIINTMLSEGAKDFKPFERQGGRISEPKYLPNSVGSIRVATGPIEGNGRMLVLRLLYKDTSEIDGDLEHRLTILGYHPLQIKDIRAAWDKPSGINLMSGPTGSGKSTTIKHILECKKQEVPEENFLSVEDPVEYQIEGIKQINADKSDFDEVLRFVVRADPDKLFVGEIRDALTLSMAIKMALSGHGVSSTVHANSALGIMKRLVDLIRSAENPDPMETLADNTVVSGLIFQKLVKINCPKCSLPIDKVTIKDDLIKRTKEALSESQFNNVRFVNLKGCASKNCRNGVIGREVVAEIILPNEELMDILKTKGALAAKRHWKKNLNGMTVIDHAIDKIGKGVLAPDNAEKAVGHLVETY